MDRRFLVALVFVFSYPIFWSSVTLPHFLLHSALRNFHRRLQVKRRKEAMAKQSPKGATAVFV